MTVIININNNYYINIINNIVTIIKLLINNKNPKIKIIKAAEM